MVALLLKELTLLVTVASTIASASAAAHPRFNSTQLAGAVFDGVLPYEGLVSYVSGTVTVPAVRLPAHADHSKTYNGSAAVGMFGWECPGAFVSAGITWTVRNHTVEYSAYFSNGSYPYVASTVKVSEGDQITLYGEVFGGGGAAQAGIDNLATGDSQSQYFPVYNNPPTCNRTAQWTVIDTAMSDKTTPFAAFKAVNFTGASYDSFDPLNGWLNRGLTNVTTINLVDGKNDVIAAGSLPSNSTVKVVYEK